MIDIKNDELEAVRMILKKNLSTYKYEARVFGSRVTGNAKKFSDLDIAIVAKGKIPPEIFERIKDDCSASSLPFTVDIVDFGTVGDKFKKIIEERFEVI
jgi:uncharacterized protein